MFSGRIYWNDKYIANLIFRISVTKVVDINRTAAFTYISGNMNGGTFSLALNNTGVH
jgi:hypothetical protein